jgi:hypothetical protein
MREIDLVDALCISQTDLVEKVIQIAHIGEVFKRASRILVWLGEHDAYSAIVFDDAYMVSFQPIVTHATFETALEKPRDDLDASIPG